MILEDPNPRVRYIGQNALEAVDGKNAIESAMKAQQTARKKGLLDGEIRAIRWRAGRWWTSGDWEARSVRRQLVAEQWDQFARGVLPKDASEAQRREMRRAFTARRRFYSA